MTGFDLAPVLARLLPSTARAAAADPAAPSEGLWPEEAAAVRAAVEARRREFAAGRRAARAAMAALGWPESAVPAGADRAPLWPAGLVGSIAHGGSACLAAVARQTDLSALGIDLEPDVDLPDDILETVATHAERDGLTPRGARALFAAKEAAYKAQYPLTRTLLDFHDLEVTLSTATFSARFTRTAGSFAAGDTLQGRLARADGHLIAAVAIPA